MRAFFHANTGGQYAKKAKTEDYEASLKQSFNQWENLYQYGGSDPFWSDGCGLNLVRNHILYYKGMIAETMPPEQYPDIYHRDTPPEVDRDYMVRADEIRINAKASLEHYSANPDYQYIRRRVNSLNPKDERASGIRRLIASVSGLKEAIAQNDLVTMRRFENPERDMDSIASAAKYLREQPRRDEQLSLFDYNDENIEDEEMEF